MRHDSTGTGGTTSHRGPGTSNQQTGCLPCLASQQCSDHKGGGPGGVEGPHSTLVEVGVLRSVQTLPKVLPLSLQFLWQRPRIAGHRGPENAGCSPCGCPCWRNRHWHRKPASLALSTGTAEWRTWNPGCCSPHA